MLSTLGSWPSVAGPGRTSSAALYQQGAPASDAVLTQRSAGGGGPPRLCHELGQGAPCLRCGPACPGFDLHYWRKACRHCSCSAAEHGVYQDETAGAAQARQLLDSGRPPPHPYTAVNSRGGRYGGVSSEPTQLEWVPPGVTPDLAERYLSYLPPGRIPVRGTSGAVLRQRSLQTQLPPQDLDLSRWHLQAGGPEAQRMQSYVQDVRQNAVGQGIVCEFPPNGPYQRGFVPNNAWGPQEPSPSPQGPQDSAGPGPGPPFSGSFTAEPESVRWPSSSIHRSPSPAPRAPFRSMGGTSGGLCRAPVTITGDQPFRGLQSVPPAPEGSVRPVSARRSRSAGRPAAASSPSLAAAGGSAPALAAPPDRPARDTRRRWCCHHCRAAMQPGDVAVFAERAGANKCWHPQCFVCATCQELLVDLIYFYKSGQVFCGRHYAERQRLSRCPACDELIFSQQYTEAGGQHWHTRHFCCAACCQPLAGQQYVLRGERPHCLDCYRQHYGKVCVTCSRGIAPSDQRISLGDELFWHATAECFHCYTCRAGLVSAPFICASNKVFCSDACAQSF
ncbi:Testin [Amphibalanus amphitrite]|uniref:Testin n=1 Tax=Amphibalanus amphitrite TaxID=1232801 RepID=A0A6A4VVG5_AMPAM|nr:Testin [Amphibalanus amphitrite]